LIKAVISDFGGVLTTPLQEAFAAFEREAGAPVTMAQIGEAMQTLEERTGYHPLFELEMGAITEDQFRAVIGEVLGVELERFGEPYFAHIHTNEEMLAYLHDLQGRGLRMALLTNNVREWEPLWRPKVPGIDELFEVIVDSAFVGMRKPDPAIYELTLERMGGVSAEECLFVDDLEPNIDAARELGFTAVRFETTEQAIRDMEAALA
jgi:epoxide hydrolase-like predicted phosphatase